MGGTLFLVRRAARAPDDVEAFTGRMSERSSQGSPLHLVYLRSGGMVVTSRPYSGWREIQDEYEDYMTSLGPWTEEELLDFLQAEYGEDDRAWGFTREGIRAFVDSAETVLRSE